MYVRGRELPSTEAFRVFQPERQEYSPSCPQEWQGPNSWKQQMLPPRVHTCRTLGLGLGAEPGRTPRPMAIQAAS